jgi:hypothetical protein
MIENPTEPGIYACLWLTSYRFGTSIKGDYFNKFDGVDWYWGCSTPELAEAVHQRIKDDAEYPLFKGFQRELLSWAKA